MAGIAEASPLNMANMDAAAARAAASAAAMVACGSSAAAFESVPALVVPWTAAVGFWESGTPIPQKSYAAFLLMKRRLFGDGE